MGVDDNAEEEEIDMLLNEIPRVISSHFDYHHRLSSQGSSSSGSLSGIAGEEGLMDDLEWQSMFFKSNEPEPAANQGSLFQIPKSPTLGAERDPYPSSFRRHCSSISSIDSDSTESEFSNPKIPSFYLDSSYTGGGISKRISQNSRIWDVGFAPAIDLAEKLDGLDLYRSPNALNYRSLDRRRLSKQQQIETFMEGNLVERNDRLMGFKGNVYALAKDQYGCRVLQQKFDEGRHQVDSIFNEIVDHADDLMVDPFANYMMQKLFHVCSNEQMLRILYVLIENPAKLVEISSNVHGTRAVQKLIETLKTNRQIALLMSALRPGFLNLMMDVHGNHVVKHCLKLFREEDNKFIFDAAISNCVDIATHRHGCCVLQLCIASSTGKHRANLVAEVVTNGLWLAQDAFGNYVVQYILGLRSPSITSSLASQFDGNYVQLSTQKFSSNVVEKCLKVFKEENKARIVFELLSASHFEQLLQHPYANYVVQSALANTRGALHVALVGAIRPHYAVLRSSPYCKRIFMKTSSKKCYAF